jgi:FAD synthase
MVYQILWQKSLLRVKPDWINEHVKPRIFIGDNAHIGKNHMVNISVTESLRHSTRITATEIKISLPENIKIESLKVKTLSGSL